MHEEEIVDLFWSEYEDFRNQRGEFSNLARFQSKEARGGKSHLWHEKQAFLEELMQDARHYEQAL